MKDFGIETKARSRAAIVEALNAFLLEESNLGHNIVLIVDESQNLKTRQLEQIRLLSNLETEKQKLLQIILVGQPELCGKLEKPTLRQINQRISVRYHIQPLDRDELRNYIAHRLRIAGSSGKLNFTSEALGKIYRYSSGTPRLINIICDRALLAGFVQNSYEINGSIIEKCLEEII